VFEERKTMGLGHDPVKTSFALALQATLELDRLDETENLLATFEQLLPGARTQFVTAHVARARAQLAARKGDAEAAERLFKGAGALFQELAVPFDLAVTRLYHGEWLAAQRRTAEAQPLFTEARQILERLEAKPWLERLTALDTLTLSATPA
jgi:tetratricopeptide (TPR) repeat protein